MFIKDNKDMIYRIIEVAFLIFILVQVSLIFFGKGFYNQSKSGKIGPSIISQTITYMSSKYGDAFSIVDTGMPFLNSEQGSYSFLLSTVSFPNEPVLVEINYDEEIEEDNIGLYPGISYKENYMAIKYEDEISELILDAFKKYYDTVNVRYDVYSGIQSNSEAHVRFQSYIGQLDSTVRAVVEICLDESEYDLRVLTNIVHEIQSYIPNIDLTVLYLDTTDFGRHDIYELYSKFDLGEFKYGVRVEGSPDSLHIVAPDEDEFHNLKRMVVSYLRDKYGIAASVLDIRELSQDSLLFSMYSNYYPVDMLMVKIEDYTEKEPDYKDNYKTIQYKNKIQDLIRAYIAMEFKQYKIDYQIDMESVSGVFDESSRFEDFMDSDELNLGTVYIAIPQSEYDSCSMEEFESKLYSIGENIAYHKKEFMIYIVIADNKDFTFSINTLFDMNYRKENSLYYTVLRRGSNSEVLVTRYDHNTVSKT